MAARGAGTCLYAGENAAAGSIYVVMGQSGVAIEFRTHASERCAPGGTYCLERKFLENLGGRSCLYDVLLVEVTVSSSRRREQRAMVQNLKYPLNSSPAKFNFFSRYD